MPPHYFLQDNTLYYIGTPNLPLIYTERKANNDNYELNKTIWVGKIPHLNNKRKMLYTFLLRSQERPKKY